MTERQINYYSLVLMAMWCLLGCAAELPTFVKKSSPKEAVEFADTPFLEISAKAHTGSVLVLLYHDVRHYDGQQRVQYDITPEEFERQMAILDQEGASVISIDQLYEHLTKGTPVPKLSVVITFDDNYEGVLRHAAPVLKKYGFEYSLFVHTDFVGNRTIGRPKMSWQQLSSMVESGNVIVGSHTASHPVNIGTSSFSSLARELGGSRAEIERHLGTECRYLAWPGGNYSTYAAMKARDDGYRMAFGMMSGLAEDSESIMLVRRVPFYKFQSGWALLKSEEVNGVRFSELPLLKYPANTTMRKGVQIIRGGSLVTGRLNIGQSIGDKLMDMQCETGMILNLESVSPYKVKTEVSLFPRVGDPPKLGQPLFLWNTESSIWVPYSSSAMNDEATLRNYLPNFESAILGNSWLVNKGSVVAKGNGVRLPRGAFVGVTREGEPVMGCANGPMQERQLAEVAVNEGCIEAVLLTENSSGPMKQSYQYLASEPRLILGISN